MAFFLAYPKIHRLKTDSYFFQQVKSGLKKFEIRKNDRNYKVGDVLFLREVVTIDKDTVYTNQEFGPLKVTYIFEGGMYGLDEEYCVLQFEVMTTPVNG